MTETEQAKAMPGVGTLIAYAFATSRSAPGGGSTFGYIAGLDGRVSSLADVILERGLNNEKVWMEIWPERRPSRTRKPLSRRTPLTAIEKAILELIKRKLSELRGAEDVWYTNGEWNISSNAKIMTAYYKAAKRAVPNSSGRGDIPRRKSGQPSRLSKILAAP